MAALTQTPTNCHLFSDSVISLVQAGEAMSIGQPAYLHSDGKYYKAISSSGVSEAAAKGIVMSPVPEADVYFAICTGGSIDLGATLAVGENYVVGGVSGEIDPEGDIASGEYPTTIGRAKTAGECVLGIKASGIAHA